jgi:hypothetical protein
MTLYRSRSSDSKRGSDPAPEGPLQALQLIEPVGDSQPFRIVPIMQASGTAVSAAELMATKVRWAERASYIVLTEDVPASFAPYNAVIRVSAQGTEDNHRDYLACLRIQEDS